MLHYSIPVLGLTATGGALFGASLATALCLADPLPPKLARNLSIEGPPPAAGTIVAVDSNGGRVAVAHGPINHVYLPRGTALFRVEDPTALTGLSAGDKIRFVVERNGTSFVITRLENSN